MVRSIDWLRQSEAEFKAATDLLSTNNFAWCCFTAQQSAEKSIKAILNHLQNDVLGHNLTKKPLGLNPNPLGLGYRLL